MSVNIKKWFADYKPYIVITAAFFAILLVVGFIMNQWILPLFIHGAKSVKVPNMVGISINSAEAMLNNANLDLEKIYEQYSEIIPKGVVINQVPKAGLSVKEGRNVYLTVSKGKETVRMPFLIGQPLAMARRTLQTAGLNVGEITYTASEIYGRDTVTVQSINSNQEVVYGQTINLTVSRGSDQQVYMPNLVGLSYSQAEQLAIESGLSITSIDTVEHDTYISGTVTSQFPESGALTNKSTGIAIKLSR